MNAIPPTAFGRSLCLRRPPLVREIRLWLMAEDVDLEAECAALGASAPPYWAFCWGSGQALARWILDHPAEVTGRRVVDLGAGCGVVGVAAALAGAETVTAVDADPDALAAVAANAAANAVDVAGRASVPERWDLLLASDVLYERPLAEAMLALCGEAAADGRGAIVAEPERAGAARPGGERLQRYDVCTFPDVDSPTRTAAVFRLCGPEPPADGARP